MFLSFKQAAASGFSGTVGAATGFYDLLKKRKSGSATHTDLADPQVRSLARAAMVLDTLSVATQTAVPVLRRVFAHKMVGKTVSGLTHGAHFNRMTGVASVALQIGAGVVEFEIARRQKDAVRASDAMGATMGSLSCGFACAKLGAVVGSVVPGPGTAIGGVAGAVIGSWGGTKFGQYCTDGIVRNWLHKKLT